MALLMALSVAPPYFHGAYSYAPLGFRLSGILQPSASNRLRGLRLRDLLRWLDMETAACPYPHIPTQALDLRPSTSTATSNSTFFKERLKNKEPSTPSTFDLRLSKHVNSEILIPLFWISNFLTSHCLEAKIFLFKPFFFPKLSICKFSFPAKGLTCCRPT